VRSWVREVSESACNLDDSRRGNVSMELHSNLYARDDGHEALSSSLGGRAA
jgi:hypothetical protein